MGYEEIGGAVADGNAAAPVHERYREEFPVTRDLIYLNHAAVAPLPRRAAEAIKWLADDALYNGSLHYDVWMAAFDGLRIEGRRVQRLRRILAFAHKAAWCERRTQQSVNA